MLYGDFIPRNEREPNRSSTIFFWRCLMDKKIIYYTTQEVAEFLGVSPSSIQRWVDSGKLKCTQSDEGYKKFNTDHLTEFAITYNISMKFLDTMKLRSSVRDEKKITSISVAR